MKKMALLTLLSALSAVPAMAAVAVDTSVPKEAKPGQSICVRVKTSPNAKCKIEAQDVGLTQAAKLMDKHADRSGKCSWQFDVPRDYKADKLPVIVTVEANGESEKSVSSIDITQP